MSKQEWKEAGTSLGHAFTSFGKTFVRSAQTTTKNVVDWAEDKPQDPKPENSSVYSDGSWRNTGKELGGAFMDAGKALLHTMTGENGATQSSPESNEVPSGNNVNNQEPNP